MALTDTHAHIYVEEFEPDRSAMIQAAEKEGINRILMPAIDSTTHPAMLAVEGAYPGYCLSMMGLHPCSVKENFREELAIAEEWLGKRPFVAIGETGLDFYWDLSFTSQQYEAFKVQAEWAIEHKIPLVIHSRNSTDECIKVVGDYVSRGLKGVFHCFSGNLLQAQQIIGLGFYLGIGGVLTFKNGGLDKVMAELPLDQVVLETDAPYLAPVPYRGKRNESKYLGLVAEKMALIKNISRDEVEQITTSNALRLFGPKTNGGATTLMYDKTGPKKIP